MIISQRPLGLKDESPLSGLKDELPPGPLERLFINKWENEYSLTRERKPKKGDVIFCRRYISAYKHFGIYAGRGKVIHFDTKELDDSNMDNAVVHETTLEEFSKGDKVYVMEYPEEYHAGSKIREYFMAENYHLYSPDETVRRAKSHIGKKGLNDDGYSFFFNNCEDFAVWCKTGVFECRQLNSWIDAIMP